MKKVILYSLLLVFISTISFAQFGGGGFRPGGGGDGDLKGRNNGSSQMQMNQEPIEKGKNKITGFVIDSVTQNKVEFVNIALYKKENLKQPVDGSMSDEQGKFTIKGLADGDYVLKITFIGYETKTVEIQKLDKNRREVVLDKILLSPSMKLLEEVTVTGQKSLIEDKVDRLVYNADVDKTSQGGNATEILKKVPMLTVDLDGNLSLRGSQNVKVFINNKPSTIMATSVADALKQIPAENIKTVEVITSPSAKYDAEGTAGIVNIITKKTNLQGLTGMVNASAGTRGSNLMGNINYKQRKVGLSLSGGGNMFYSPNKFTNIQEITKGLDLIKTNQTADGRTQGLFGNTQLGFDYELSKKSSLTSSVRYGVRGFNNKQDLFSQTFKNTDLIGQFNRDIASKNQNQSVDVNLDYVKTFAKEQKEFSILSQFSQSNGVNDFNTDILSVEKILTSRQKNNSSTINKEATLQVDYQFPIKKTQLMEMGVKGILRDISNDFHYFLGDTQGNYTVDTRFPTNGFNLNQDIAASYLSYTLSTKKKYSMKLGSRYEYTYNDGKFKDGKDMNIKSYGNFVPSVQFSKKFGTSTTLKVSYNRRIQRPSMRFLSPNVDVSNPLNQSTGNPELLPELTDAYELGFSTFKKANSINISLFTRQTNNAITQVRTTNDLGGILSQYLNVGKEQTYGVNLFGSTRITQKWQLNLGSNAYYAKVSNPSTNQTNAGWVIDGNYFLMGQIGKGYAVQSFGFIRSPRVQLQGKQSGFAMMNLGARKDFTLKSGNKGSFGVGIDNPFTNGYKFKSTFESVGLYQQTVTQSFSRGIRFMFSYQFGKMTFGAAKKKSVKNDDLKEEEGSSQGGGNTGGGRPMGPR